MPETYEMIVIALIQHTKKISFFLSKKFNKVKIIIDDLERQNNKLNVYKSNIILYK